MDKNGKLYIAGHTGLFGSALLAEAQKRGFTDIVLRTHAELDLTDQAAADRFFEKEHPDYVIMAAALVGGIKANSERMADFCMQNLQMTCNIINAAHKYQIKKLLYLGSSCIYPRECAQPIREDSILTGPCEPTNEGYAIAKIAGIRLCEYYKKQYGDNFISCIPANVYGPHDCFIPGKAHVIPALLMRFHDAKVKGLPEVTVWGTGKAEREFLFIDDAAEGCMDLMEHYDGGQTVNIGVGHTDTIAELAELVKKVVGYTGKLCFDATKPDGMPRRLLDTQTADAYHIHAKTTLDAGLRLAYRYYLNLIEGKGESFDSGKGVCV